MPTREALVLVTVGSIVCGLFVSLLANLATTIYLHRHLTHGSWKITFAPLEFALRFILWTTTGIKRWEWVAVHTHHHAMTDVPGDPHSPHIEGLGMVLFRDAKLYRRSLESLGKDNVDVYVQRWAKNRKIDRWDLKLFSHGNIGLSIGISLAIAASIAVWTMFFGLWMGLLSGLIGGLVWSGFHMWAYIFLGGCVNGICHRWGTAFFGNLARNNWLVALLTAGEGFHNNHHGRQKSARLWVTWLQLLGDWGYWYIWLFCRLGWAQLDGLMTDRVIKRRRHDLPRDSRKQVRTPRLSAVAA